MADLSWSCFLVLAGLALLCICGEGPIKSSSSIWLRRGPTLLVIGLTVTAFASSPPELLVGVQAAIEGRGDFAVGSVVGSNIFNLLGILGTAVLVAGSVSYTAVSWPI